ncbi:hypothetical protein AB6809_29690 [Paraburkholderia sp. RCC_158]|uniref:hypothetical protein n=1 Tax=Paraburkholderia sp. RCC_158 TaxID=3239220 RepID=UPI003525CB63
MTAPNFELLKDAYAIIDGIPDDNLALNRWRTKDQGSSCGTIACAAGWLTLHPKFQELGLGVKRTECDQSMGPWPSFAGQTRIDALAVLFRLEFEDAYGLFGERWNTPARDLGLREQATDKEIFLARVLKFLSKHGQLKEQLERRAHQQAVVQRALTP